MARGGDDTPARLRAHLVRELVERGELDDLAWRGAVETVPRHRFVPAFYLPAETPDEHGLTVWEPVTERRDRDRWLAGAYADRTLVTEVDGTRPDVATPTRRHGGMPTASATQPGLLTRMWADADVRPGHTVLKVGTGMGYGCALACERLGSAAVTSVDDDPERLRQAADALFGCGHNPTLDVADGAYGYWPRAPYDRVVAVHASPSVPPGWMAQTRPGGKVFTVLSGGLHGYARALLTVHDARHGEGVLLPGSVSFMAARTHAVPLLGDPVRWGALATGRPRPARHGPQVITEPTEEAFQLRFLAQSAVPRAQLLTAGDVVYLVDPVDGAAAVLSPVADDSAPDGLGWMVREGGPSALWGRVEHVLDTWQAAGRPGLDTVRLHVDGDRQWLSHPALPRLGLTHRG